MTPQELKELVLEARGLAQRSMNLWLSHGQDPKGGFFGFLDRNFSPVVDPLDVRLGPSGERRGDKGLIQQSRHLYSLSLWEEIQPGDRRVAEAAHQLAEFILRAFARGAGEPFRHLVGPSGEPGEDRVQAYAQGFAIFGLATYGRVFQSRIALEQAMNLFHWLERNRHESGRPGYDQTNDGGWLEMVGAPPQTSYCTNTVIHLLEAFTALFRARPDPLVGERLAELRDLIIEYHQSSQGYVRKYLDRDYRPLEPDYVSYGHDLETAWLLLDAEDALADSRAGTRIACERMARYALQYGSCPRTHGIYDFGAPERENEGHRVLSEELVWWAQAESLLGIFCCFELTGDATLLHRLGLLFRCFRELLWDEAGGDFYWGVMPSGKLGPRGDHKGELWKTTYHSIRALLLLASRIEASLGPADRAAPA